MKWISDHSTIKVDVRGGGSQSTGGGTTIGAGTARRGYIQGPGTKTSDSILHPVSTGEYVVQACAVDKYGPDLMARTTG